jgi:SAM-dependent methyltransferase
MTLTYYSRAATQAFWAEHWGGHSPAALARVAATSPLTDLLARNLPPPGATVLEAGCGLGQYVVLLRERGYRAVGVDWATDSLHACRAWAKDTPLAAMDLGQLGFASGAFAAYVSLGVVEHDPAGPGRILAEAHRVLAEGGTLLLSVPYVNLVRRLGARRIRRANERVRAAGGTFYQFAFSRGEVKAAVERAGFRVIGATPYDPARVLRGAWRRLQQRHERPAAATRPAAHADTSLRATRESLRGAAAAPASRRVLGLVRRLLYTRPALHAFGHMILLVAVKR